MAAAVGFDAFHLTEHLLTQPLQIVAGERPGAFGSLRDAYELFGRAASKNEDLFVVPGASHYDLYDQPKATGMALEKIIPFFKEYLS
ncbi:alpha/beta hydrolase [Olivibacter sitiensis]|uniref:alpha/beta hydrolase n=1 Tax=Olivibacter sitiensis TaxID=376470 RepID=UPI00041BD1EC|nr:alpha/beta hydrolase [Olivibacter sitiensis]